MSNPITIRTPPFSSIFWALPKQSNLQPGKIETTIKLAACYGIINIYHPFAEGNGRTQRIFLSSLASELHYSIEWHRVSAWEIVETSKQAHIGNYEPLEALMVRIVVDEI